MPPKKKAAKKEDPDIVRSEVDDEKGDDLPDFLEEFVTDPEEIVPDQVDQQEVARG